ncbi:MAG: hypothetical protein ACO39R_06855 [Pontimonas sp.]
MATRVKQTELWDLERQDSIWFMHAMNPVSATGWEGAYASVYVIGDVKFVLDGERYRDVEALFDAGIDTDEKLWEAESSGRLEWENNNWFEVMDDSADEFTGIIAHDLRDALEQAFAYLARK